MAKKSKKVKESVDTNSDIDNYISDFKASERFVATKRADWDDKENMLFSKLTDEITSDETKSQIHDPRLSTYVLERSGRTTAQLPKGVARAISKSNRGKAALMNLITDKYILPNANSQFPFLTKLKLMQVYSNVYGSFFGLVDWVVDKRRNYVGPDLFLPNIRDVFPQVGAVSLEDSDYINIASLKTKSWLESRDPETWEGIQEILDDMNNPDPKGTSRAQMSSERISKRYSEYYSDDQESERNPYIEVVTRYERDEWITFLPSYNKIIRRIDNPHKNGLLPVVAKYNLPVIEDFFGLGEFERGESLQKSLDSLINLYFDGVKMSLFPPLQINTDGVTASSIKMRPGAKWLVDRPNVDIQSTQVSPRGMDTFVSSYQYLLGALQNSQGTSETNISMGSDMTLGKTPQALKMQSRRENVRDSMERYQMEQTVTQIMERFINLQAQKMPSALVLTLFDKEIDEIASEFPDLVEIFSDGNTGKVTIDKKELVGKYIYDIDSGSMSRRDEADEIDNLHTILRLAINGAQIEPKSGEITSPILKAMEMSGYKLNVGEILKRIIIKSGTENWDKIVEDGPDPEVLARANALEERMDGFLATGGQPAGGQTPGGPPAPQPNQPLGV